VEASLHFQKAKDLTKSAKYDSSNFYFNAALAIYDQLALQEPSKRLTAQRFYCHREIGKNYLRHEDFEKALIVFEEARSIGKKVFVENTIEIADIYLGLGDIAVQQDNYEKGEFYLKKCLSSLMASPKPNNELMANLHFSFGRLYSKRGDLERALERYKKSLAQYLELYGEGNVRVSYTYNNMAVVHASRGEMNPKNRTGS